MHDDCKRYKEEEIKGEDRKKGGSGYAYGDVP